jgi:HSP20 family molecular chaperone IbpA
VYFVVQNGETVFVIAALAGASKETMQVLLDSGCDIDALDSHEKSVRDVCKAAGTFYKRLLKFTTNV